MTVRGIRGAITVEADDPQQILEATREMLLSIMQANPGLETEDIASALFSVTADLKAAHPAVAARQIGWTSVPLFGTGEIPVPGSLPLCIRVLVHWNTSIPQKDIQHVYLRSAVALRPDLLKHTNEQRNP